MTGGFAFGNTGLIFGHAKETNANKTNTSITIYIYIYIHTHMYTRMCVYIYVYMIYTNEITMIHEHIIHT